MVSQLGEFLRQHREAQGITLEELQARTKIRIKYLEAIEAGDYAVIPGEVYLRGFIRSVAKELGIDQQEAMDLYYQESRPASESVAQPAVTSQPPAAAQEKSQLITPDKPEEAAEKPTPRQQLTSPPPQPAALSRSHKKKRTATTPRLLWLLVLAGVIVGGILLWDRLMEQPPIVNDPLPQNNGQEEPDPDPEPEPPPVVVELQNPGERNPVYHVSPGPIEIVLKAEGGACWVGASADGGPQQQATLNPGGQTSSLTVQAEDEIVVRVGNPGALRVTINGVDQGIIGGTRAIDLTVKLQPES